MQRNRNNHIVKGILYIFLIIAISIVFVAFVNGLAVYDGVETVTITGNETLPSICSQLGNATPDWRCWGTSHYTAYRLVVDTSSKLTINQGEKLYIGLGLDLYGELRIDRGFIYMNTSEGISNTIGGGASIINITGTPKLNRIPSPTENYDAGILLYPEDSTTYINFYIFWGKQFYIRDAKIDTFAFELDETGKKDIQRSYLRAATHWIFPILALRDNDILKNTYLDSGNKQNTGNFFFIYALSGAGINITNVFINQTNSAYSGIYAEEGSITDYFNGGMDNCFINYHMTTATPTRLSFHNTSFTRNRTLENCRIVPFPGSDYDFRNNITFSYPLDLFIAEDNGIQEVFMDGWIYRKRYLSNWTMPQEWELIDTFNTGFTGRVRGHELTALNFVSVNQTERYIYLINVSKVGHDNQSFILNWSDYNRGVIVNLTTEENFNVTMDINLNISPVQYVNISRINGFLSGSFVSNYYPMGYIWIINQYRNITAKRVFNNTVGVFDLENATIGKNEIVVTFGNENNPAYYGEKYYTLYITNTSGNTPVGGADGAYISIAMIIIASIGFLIIIALKFDHSLEPIVQSTEKNYLLWAIRLFFLTIGCWVMVALFSFLQSIIALERFSNMTRTAEGLFVAMVVISLLVSSAFILGVFYIGVKRFFEWGSKFGK